MLNSKEGFDNTLSMHVDMFPSVPQDQEGYKELSFFTDSQKAEIRTRIHDYEMNPKSRNRGAALITKIKNVAIAKKELLKFIEDIKDLLEPHERKERVSVKEAEVLNEQRNINKVTESYRKAFPSEKMLRAFADTILGEEIHGDYTFEELPLVIATKQITGKLIPIDMGNYSTNLSISVTKGGMHA